MHGRLRQEGGFGLLELLMAMTILNVGILAVVAAFNSGTVALRRSGAISTATVLADKQMELYRALTYGSIALDPSSIPSTTPYTSDAAWASTQITTSCNTPLPPECNASQLTTGPDRHRYRVIDHDRRGFPAVIALADEPGRDDVKARFPAELEVLALARRVGPDGDAVLLAGRPGRDEHEQCARARDVDVRLLDSAPLRFRLPDYLAWA